MMYGEMVELRDELGYSQFTKLQESAFGNQQMYDSSRLWICGDTSSGKTLIPCLFYAQARRETGKSVRMLYIVPYRALALQKYNELKAMMKKLCRQHTEVAMSTAEYREDDSNILEGNLDIAIMIYEKAYVFAGNRDFMKYYDYIVFDEFGIVADDGRGAKADLLMLWALKLRKRIIVLSTPYIDWEDYIRTYRFLYIREMQRPVKLNTIPVVRDREKACSQLKSSGDPSESDRDFIWNGSFLQVCRNNLAHGLRLLLCVDHEYDTITLAEALCRGEGLAGYLPAYNQNEFKIRAGIVPGSELDRCLDERMYHIFCSGIAVLSPELPDSIREFVREELESLDKQAFQVIICTEEYMYSDRDEAYILVAADRTRNSMISGICEKHLRANHKILIFVNDRAEIHTIACDLYQRLNQAGVLEAVVKPERGQTYQELLLQKTGMQDIADTLYGVMGEEDCKAVLSGIGVHSAALPQEFREYIERLLCECSDEMKIVVSTETLAFGINSNVDVVIIADMVNNGIYMNLNEYNNCAGRAGRMRDGEISDQQEGYIYPVLNAGRLDDWFRLSAQSAEKAENTLARLDANHSALYVLSMLGLNDNMTYDDLCHELSSMPMSFGKVEEQADDILQMLEKRGMIRCIKDAFLSDISVYRLSSIGKMMKGYPVSLDTYDKMLEIIAKVGRYPTLPLFDVIFHLCFTEPMKRMIHRVFSGASRNRLDEEESQSDEEVFFRWARRETELFGRGFLKENLLSQNLYDDLRREMRNNNDVRLNMRVTLILICWAAGAKIRYLYNTFSIPYGLVKQMGEQMSYLLEAAAAVAHGSMETIDCCKALMAYSSSLFYGVPSEVLAEFAVPVMPANRRRLASLGFLLRMMGREKRKLKADERKRIKGILEEAHSLPEDCRKKVQNLANSVLY